jgi:CheY-like chemotaxis protein
MRILYVEDNPANVFLVKRVAKMGQHEIINFIDGGEAIRKYNDVNPDLVLMDIQLVGETSGLEVVKQLRAKGVTTPIIAVTAYAMVGDKERCIEAGCNDYLAKPLPIPRLIEIFQEYEASVKAKPAATPVNTVAKVAEPAPPVAATITTPAKADEPQPETVADTKTQSAEPMAQVATEATADTPKVEPVADAKPVTTIEATPDIHKVETKRVTEPLTETSDTEKVQTKSAVEEAKSEPQTTTMADENKPVAEVKTATTTDDEKPVAEVKTTSPSETSAASQATTATVSSSIHEDPTLPEKPAATDTTTTEAPKTEASPTEANG